MKRLALILIISISSLLVLNAQELSKKELYKQSKKAFYNEQFQQALRLLLQYDSLYPGDYEVNYRIGACYLNTRDKKRKAIPYLEYVYQKNYKLLPPIVVKQLADFYLRKDRLDDAEKMYKRYLKLTPGKDKAIKKKLQTIKFTRALMQDSLKINISNIGNPVNTLNSEITPIVLADESVMYYQEKISEKIYVAFNQLGRWTHKQEVMLPDLSKYSVVNLAGVSVGGRKIFMQLGDGVNNNLYVGEPSSDFICEELHLLDSCVNSPYSEASASLSADGQAIYFSSNRPGGYGKYDIYKCEKDSNGNWTEAVNLGANINTSGNEIYPFIHPSMDVIYFSSDDKNNTLGGYDIFESKLKVGEWQQSRNIGYPINTRLNELSYSLTAEGSAAYFSSIRKDVTLHYDIYKAHLKNNVPLTLVKGHISAGIPPKPITAKIKVFDKVSGEKMRYIYPPNARTGNYLMIFPPGKAYDMHVTAEGYKPYIIDLFLPNQTYFCENFQEIYLRPIHTDSSGKVIGEEIIVNNKFFDSYNEDEENHPSIKYSKLLKLIEQLIETTDSLGLNEINAEAIEDNALEKNQRDYMRLFNLVEQAIETNDSTALKMLDESTVPDVLLRSEHFYQQDNFNAYDSLIFESDTILGIRVNDTINRASRVDRQDLRKIKSMALFFKKNAFEVPVQSVALLKDIAQVLIKEPSLYIKVQGFASDEENASTASSRAESVKAHFVNQNVSANRIKIEAPVVLKLPINSCHRVELKIQEDGKLVPLMDLTKDEEYRVQILAGPNHLNKNHSFFKAKEVVYYSKKGQILRYFIKQSFSDLSSANKFKDTLVKEGFTDAFVVKFINGVSVD